MFVVSHLKLFIGNSNFISFFAIDNQSQYITTDKRRIGKKKVLSKFFTLTKALK